MPSDVSLKVDLKAWDKLKKDISTKSVIKLGILGEKNIRKNDSVLTNAEIGARHEFGVLSEGLPRRSFLLDPILEKRDELTETAGKILRSTLPKENGVKEGLKKIGIASEKIVLKAFDTGGYGKWKPLSDQRIREKQEQNLAPGILMATTQLSKSIASKVEEGEE